VTCWVAAGVALVGALIAFVALPRHQPAPAAAIDPEIDLEAEAADAGLALTPAVYAGDDAA